MMKMRHIQTLILQVYSDGGIRQGLRRCKNLRKGKQNWIETRSGVFIDFLLTIYSYLSVPLQGFHVQKLRRVTKISRELRGARKKYQTVPEVCVILPETK